MPASYPSVRSDGYNSGYVPDPAGGGRSREQFEVLWSSEVDGELRATPVVSAELVVVGDTDGVVYAFDAIDGHTHWQTTLATPSVFSTAAVADGTIFVSGFDDLNRAEETTYALELATGDVRWTRAFGQGGKTAIATDDERVYVRTYDGTCHALAADTGETVWRLYGERWGKTPALVDETVVLGDGDRLLALDAERGTVRWQAELNGRVRTPLAVADGRVFVVAGSSELWCFDVTTGQTRWRVAIGEAIRDDQGTGDPLLPLGGSVLHSTPVTDGESVVAGIYRGLVELDATHGCLRHYHPLDRRVGDLLLVGGERERRLYGHVSDEGLTEFRLTADAVPVRSTSRDTLDVGPTYAAGVFYLVTGSGTVCAVT